MNTFIKPKATGSKLKLINSRNINHSITSRALNTDPVLNFYTQETQLPCQWRSNTIGVEYVQRWSVFEHIQL